MDQWILHNYKLQRPFVCVSVCTPPPPPFRHDRQTKFGTHMRIDPSIIRSQIFLDPPHPRGSQGGFRGSTSKNSGKCHELPSKSIKRFNSHPTGGGGGGSFRSQTFGKFHNLPRKSIHFVTPHPTHPGGGVLWDTISASSFEKYIGIAIILSHYTANIPRVKPGNQMEGGRREGGREEGGREGGNPSEVG